MKNKSKTAICLYLMIFILVLFSFSCDQPVELNNPFDPNISLSPPSDLQIISITDTSLTLKWHARYKITGSNQKETSAIVVEESLDGTTFSFLDNLSAADTIGTIRTSFDTIRTYYFRVHATIGNRTTVNSNIVHWCRLSFNPFGLSFANVSETGRTLNWQDTSSLVQTFQIERRTGMLGNFNLIGEVPANVTIFHDTTIILTDTTYYYRVRAISKGGLISLYNTASISVSFSPPSNLTCNGNYPGSVNLQWINNYETIVGTIVEKSDDNINYVELDTVGPVITTFSDNTVDHRKVYFYRVRNFTQFNKSYYSNTIRVFYGSDSLHLVRTLAFATPQALGGPFGSLLVSRNGSTVLFWSNDGSLTDWDINTGALLHTFQLGQPISRVSLSGDGKTIGIMDSSAGSFSFYSSEDGHLIQNIIVPPPAIDMEISNDGSTVITSSTDSSICVWNVTNGSLIRSLYSNQKPPISIFLTEGGDTLISGGGNTLCFWDWQSGTILKTTTGGYFNKPIFLLTDGRVVNIQSAAFDITINDLSTGEITKTIKHAMDYTNSFKSGYLTADGTTLLVGIEGWIYAYNLIPDYPIRASSHITGSLVVARIGNGNTFVAKDWVNLYDGNLMIIQMQFKWMDAISDFFFHW